MMRLVHKTFGHEVQFDFSNGKGILGAFADKRKIAWESVTAVIGYPKKPGLFRRRFGIDVAFQEQGGEIQHGEVFSTSNEWKYHYFLERTVAYMSKNMSAMGGEAWCARPLNVDGELEDNDLFISYIDCRILADKLEIQWFEHSQEDEAAVALTFIKKRLVADGTEVSQLSQAIEETRFHIMEDGSVSVFRSTGYRILEDHLLRMINKGAQQRSARDK
jgi:hypothetical protein